MSDPYTMSVVGGRRSDEFAGDPGRRQLDRLEPRRHWPGRLRVRGVQRHRWRHRLESARRRVSVSLNWAALSYSALQWIAAALSNLTGKFCSAAALHCKFSLQVRVTFEDGVRNKLSPVEHAIMSATSSPNTSCSIDDRNLNIFHYKVNLYTKLVCKQIGAALQTVKVVCSAYVQRWVT